MRTVGFVYHLAFRLAFFGNAKKPLHGTTELWGKPDSAVYYVTAEIHVWEMFQSAIKAFA